MVGKGTGLAGEQKQVAAVRCPQDWSSCCRPIPAQAGIHPWAFSNPINPPPEALAAAPPPYVCCRGSNRFVAVALALCQPRQPGAAGKQGAARRVAMTLCSCRVPTPVPAPTRLYLLVARVSDPEVACGLPQSGAHGSFAAPRRCAAAPARRWITAIFKP